MALPLREVSRQELPPNLVLMVKILAVALLVKGTGESLPVPFLPFLPGLDRCPPELFRGLLTIVFYVSAAGVLSNRGLRLACLGLGGSLVLAVLSSQIYYSNNKLFTGLVLILTGLTNPARPLWPFRAQLAIVYFGACLNKALDPDWRSGQFMNHWLGVQLHNPVYQHLSECLPPLMLGCALSWLVIVAEGAMVLGFLCPRGTSGALALNALFHLTLVQLTGWTFGEFFFAMLAVSLAFVAWPQPPRSLLYSARLWLPLTAAAAFLVRIGAGWPLRVLVGLTAALVAWEIWRTPVQIAAPIRGDAAGSKRDVLE